MPKHSHGRCLRLSFGYSLWASPNAPELCVSDSPYWRSFMHCFLRMAGPPTKVREQRRMSGTIRWVGWSWATTLEWTAKRWFKANPGRRTKHTTVCSSASVAERCTGNPKCLTPTEVHIDWAIIHWSSVGYVVLWWSYAVWSNAWWF